LEGLPVQRLSIIVPLMGDLKRLEDTLVSVLENQPERSDVVVVLNQPYDDPYELSGEVKFVDAPCGADLVDCLACGLAASGAPLVHVITAGFEAAPGWTDSALPRFDDPTVAAVGPVVVDRENPGIILSAGLSYSSAGSVSRIATGTPLDRLATNDTAFCSPELAVAFYRRNALEAIATLQHLGTPTAVAVDLGLALRGAGYGVVRENTCITSGSRDMLSAAGPGYMAPAWREGLASERLYRRWATVPGDPAYRVPRRSRAAHAGRVALECLQLPLRPSNLARLAGRFWAVLGFGSPRAVAIGRAVATGQSEAVIRPPHFASSEVRPALTSRAG
jgi:hypothetical protein